MRARPDFQVHLGPEQLALQQLAAPPTGRSGGPAGDDGKDGAVRRHGGRGGGKVRMTAASGQRRYAFRRS